MIGFLTFSATVWPSLGLHARGMVLTRSFYDNQVHAAASRGGEQDQRGTPDPQHADSRLPGDARHEDGFA